MVRELEAAREHIKWYKESKNNPNILAMMELYKEESATRSRENEELRVEMRMLQFQVKELSAVVRELTRERI